MKLLIITCLKENSNDVFSLLKQANIGVFSVTDIVGVKTSLPANLLEEWFAHGDEKFDSLLLFSFTTAENVGQCLQEVAKFNNAINSDFPVKAFVLPVENFL